MFFKTLKMVSQTIFESILLWLRILVALLFNTVNTFSEHKFISFI